MRFSSIMKASQQTVRYVTTPVPAGVPAYLAASEEVDLNSFFQVRNPLLVEVIGRSLEDTGIVAGDSILLSMGAMPNNGDIVMVRLDREEYTLKKWKLDDKWGGERRLFLVPANEEMQPREITASDPCEVVGVVKYIFKRA
jgi:SOS-response transcriptional repressor LexA